MNPQLRVGRSPSRTGQDGDLVVDDGTTRRLDRPMSCRTVRIGRDAALITAGHSLHSLTPIAFGPNARLGTYR